MTQHKLKIVSVSAEIAPFVKTGGLGEVTKSLSKAMAKLGHEVIAIAPYHHKIKDYSPAPKLIHKNLKIEIDTKNILYADIYESGFENSTVKIYFIDNPDLFSNFEPIYSSEYDNKRFLFFNAAIKPTLKAINFKPDIIQCHDWHTALIPNFIHKHKTRDFNPATIFTVHNLAFQLGGDWWAIPENKRDLGTTPLPLFSNNEEVSKINFALRGILYADIISAVSEHYAREIMTKKFGENLDKHLKTRKKELFGIINGIDYNEYNPQTDPGLPEKFSVENFSANRKNKTYLQKYFGIEVNPSIPLAGMVSRITEQKGFDLLIEILPALMKLNLQLAIMGGGDNKYEKIFTNATKKYAGKFGYKPFEQKRETLVYAGSNFFLMPSRFEPCGLGQLLSLRYGSIPIVHRVGGLSETIMDFKPKTNEGNGFVFSSYKPESLLAAIIRALELYKSNPEVWEGLMSNALKQVYSWELPATKYIALFKKAMIKHRFENIRPKDFWSLFSQH
ncbi:MAG: Glycogen synthase [Parcubacteria group bacterium GW2011_GWA2_40_8]|nr:MAG: Glycogen synthase [Parcubacteria group bacterium GW2011_GWB1_40_14]KKR78951.1 MAG: Glycogen synthase [Parcubacteria group bacterium GW2011_GWA2_40_8]